VIFLATSSPAGDEAIEDLMSLEQVHSVKRIEL